MSLDDDEDEGVTAPLTLVQHSPGNVPVIRPGIVHRLDKGTTGLNPNLACNLRHFKLILSCARQCPCCVDEYEAAILACTADSAFDKNCTRGVFL